MPAYRIGRADLWAHTGSLLFNPINAWLLYNYDFRVAFRFSAAVILTAGTLCSWSFTAADSGASTELVQDDDDDDDWSTDGESLRRCTTTDVVRRPEMVLWYAGNCLSYLGFYMPFVNLVLLLVFNAVYCMHAKRFFCLIWAVFSAPKIIIC